MVRFRKLRGEQEDADRSSAEEQVAKAPDKAATKADEQEPLEEALAEDVELEDETKASEEADQSDPLDEIMNEDLDDEDEGAEQEDLGIDDVDPDGEDAVDDLEGAGDTTALKELAARMAVLQSNLENVQGSRGDLEEKLATMEDRMLRLGNLAEAVSKEYNPFIAENSPEEPTWQGQGAPSEEPAEEAQQPPEATPAPTSQPPPPAEPEPRAGDPIPEDTPPPQSELGPGLGAQRDAEPEDPVDQALGHLGVEGGLGGRPEPAQDPIDALESFGQAARPPKGDPMEQLQENFMLLEWVGLMLRRVGRANLLDLLEYYEGLGWMSPQIKRQVVRVAVGIDAPEDGSGGEWRGDLDLHERSLVTIQRLEGNEITAADVEGLRMDMRRLFGE